jgi:predicted O-linked N-acetylglucosamine transferase (SPINDLY family)
MGTTRLTLTQVRKLLAGLLDDGRFAQAAILARRLVAAHPDDVFGLQALGAALASLGRLEEARAQYLLALAVDPDLAEAHNNLGNVLQRLGRLGEAAASYERALALCPDFAAAHGNLGNAWLGLGRLEEAAVHYRRLLECGPDSPEGRHALGAALLDLGRADEAAPHLARAVALRPGQVEARNALGVALTELGRTDEALAHLTQALAARPDFAAAHNNSGAALLDLGRAEEAAAHFARALELEPDLATARTNLGQALERLGRADAAVACHQRALALRPDDARVHGNLLFALAHQAGTAPEDYLAQARAWERTALTKAERQAAAHIVFHNPSRLGRRLRVGYVSGDFRRHAVASFLPGFLAGHDRDRVEVFAYATSLRQDAVTWRLRSLVEHWRELAGTSDQTATEAIRRDGIDVLVDLSGHTSQGRLGLFARRAAPVQTHYLGYFASTGLSAMDYFLADALAVPEGEETHFTETVWRLPRVRLAYHGDEAAPEPLWRPDPEGRLRFGGCYGLGKLTPACVALWGRVLHRCPRGHLLLKTAALGSAAARDQVRHAFAAQGIGPERLRLLGATPGWSEHMAVYHDLDVALDPAGGHGGVTTTCDALWMGVPVVSLTGAGLTRRMCASILDALGRPDWIASDEDAYVETAVALAEDAAGRRALRSELRRQLRRSPLGDGPGLARALEDAYKAMFDRWREQAAGRAGGQGAAAGEVP